MEGLVVSVTTTFLNWRTRAAKAVRWGTVSPLYRAALPPILSCSLQREAQNLLRMSLVDPQA
jgi:hypothetical protein